jgi:membrane protein DedA with SNARE-associated domain
MHLFETVGTDIIAFTRTHQNWAPFIVALLCFAESLAVVSFFVPATVILIGGILGDWLSYFVGFYFKDSAHQHWPLSRYPEFTKRADEFTRKWGAIGVFVGRFSGPLRAFVPLAAGIFAVPQWKFQIANVGSAIVWGFVLLAPGWGLFKYISQYVPH